MVTGKRRELKKKMKSRLKLAGEVLRAEFMQAKIILASPNSFEDKERWSALFKTDGIKLSF